MAKLHLTHVGITVSDMARSIAFYELLGFKQSKPDIFLGWEDFWLEKNYFYQHPEGTTAKVVYMAAENGICIELFAFDYPADRMPFNWKSPAIHHIAMQTDDLDAVYQKLVDAGAEIALRPVRGKIQAFIFVRDPDGNLIEIAQPY